MALTQRYDNQALDDLSYNLIISVAGTCAIQMDTALDELFGTNKQENPDTDIASLRAAVYMLRCAFAHNPLRPVWEARASYQKRFQIPTINFSLDATQLDGRNLMPNQFGGWEGFARLIQYCMEIAERTQKGTSYE